ncbi:MAG: tRNA pseudouridine(55) synthase [Bacteroidota bacterium]|jgi:tRNA pseudouridine55 synthase
MTREEIQAGKVLLVDKPYEWTSFQAVSKIRYAFQKELGLKKLKVGHAGTLDPLATGLLIICIGKETKSISNYMGMEKEYIAEIKFGATTPSYDLETEEDMTFPTDHLSEAVISAVLPEFTGSILQYPPIFSAIKKDGVRAYEKARAGEEIKMDPRQIEIHELEIQGWKENVLTLRVRCGKGTYIRSLAHDLGKACGSGAYLVGLRRTRIGHYDVKNAAEPTEIVAQYKAQFES